MTKLWNLFPSIRPSGVRTRKIIILFFNQNICCGYSKEPSQWDDSFEHSKHMLKVMGKKIFTSLLWFFCLFKPMNHFQISQVKSYFSFFLFFFFFLQLLVALDDRASELLPITSSDFSVRVLLSTPFWCIWSISLSVEALFVTAWFRKLSFIIKSCVTAASANFSSSLLLSLLLEYFFLLLTGWILSISSSVKTNLVEEANSLIPERNRGSCMSAHVLLKLLNSLRKSDEMAHFFAMSLINTISKCKI